MSEFGAGVDIRHGSPDDLHVDQATKATNYEDTVKQLDTYYGIGWTSFYSLPFSIMILIRFSFDYSETSIAALSELYHRTIPSDEHRSASGLDTG